MIHTLPHFSNYRTAPTEAMHQSQIRIHGLPMRVLTNSLPADENPWMWLTNCNENLTLLVHKVKLMVEAPTKMVKKHGPLIFELIIFSHFYLKICTQFMFCVLLWFGVSSFYLYLSLTQGKSCNYLSANELNLKIYQIYHIYPLEKLYYDHTKTKQKNILCIFQEYIVGITCLSHGTVNYLCWNTTFHSKSFHWHILSRCFVNYLWYSLKSKENIQTFN